MTRSNPRTFQEVTDNTSQASDDLLRTGAAAALLGHFIIGQHVARQSQIADELNQVLAQQWQWVDMRDIPRSGSAFTTAATRAVADAYEQSQVAADQFVRELRAAVHPEAEPLPALHLPSQPEVMAPVGDRFPVGAVIRAGAPDTGRIARIMDLAGPNAALERMPAPTNVAMTDGLRSAQGVATRMALTGGRKVVLQHQYLDKTIQGWERVTEPGCCAFCAVLASRGPVFKESTFPTERLPDGSYATRSRNTGKTFTSGVNDLSESAVPAAVHNNCRCTLRPVFKNEPQSFQAENKNLKKLWSDTTKGLHGKAALNAFRRFWDSGTPPPLPEVRDPAVERRVAAEQILPMLKTGLANLLSAPEGHEGAIEYHQAQIKRLESYLVAH
ncbi:VG15 protein [Tsukamurella soli]|uniref:VG15 protein n=1 Tax=Tsukamurella soli TaxID=644556 RepID=UPI00361E4D23